MDNLTPEEIQRLKRVAAREERRQRYIKRLPFLVVVFVLIVMSGTLSEQIGRISPVLGILISGAACIALPLAMGYAIYQGYRINVGRD